MAQLKKNTARLILQGISLFGVLLGFSLVCVAISTAIGVIAEAEWDNLALVCAAFALSAVLLALGAYVIYTSYLLFRRRAFGAVVSISVLSAFFVVGGVMQSISSFAGTSAGERRPGCVEVIGTFAACLL